MSGSTIEFLSQSVHETIEFGKKIGQSLKGGEVICLDGPLGAGKTHLVKGIACGLGLEDANEVNSPTFVMVNEYQGRFDIYHIDAYRVESIAEFENLGFLDFIGPGAVVLIEWSNKVLAGLSDIDCIRIELHHGSDNCRKIHITNAPEVC